jgi:hypothetical protein
VVPRTKTVVGRTFTSGPKNQNGSRKNQNNTCEHPAITLLAEEVKLIMSKGRKKKDCEENNLNPTQPSPLSKREGLF